MLEVIDKGSCTPPHPVPLLFVHGGWHGAWCWDEHFLDFFADRGFRAAAVSVRGHGRSPLSQPRHSCSLADYLDDVRFVNTARLAREHLFCVHTPETTIESCAARLQRESLRAVFVDALFRLPKPRSVTTPLLVLGGEDDGIVSAASVRATARAYHTRAEFFPTMGHDMMLEPGWADVAERIHTWLGDRGL
jgi:pimeloyl-ACP methyl ester carboxylesterase